MRTRMEFGLLGPLRVRQAGADITVAAGKQRAVLAALLLSAGRVVPAEDLTSILWGEVPPPSASVSLRNYLTRLRKSLGNDGHQRISTHPRGYMISTRPGELDLEVFESLLAAARTQTRSGAWDAAATGLAQALALWRGDPLADVDSDELALRELPRLAELRLQATEARIDADLHLGRQAEVIAELQSLVGAYPLREPLHGLLMLALYLDGRQGEALACYQRVRHILTEELGTEPGTVLHNLHQRILTGKPALSSPSDAGPTETVFPGSEVATAAAVNMRFSLPPDSAAFTGREAELDRITATMLDRARAGGVVAIHAIGGMPGVGKTTLALHAAHLLRDRFPDRCLFIDLHAHTPGRSPMLPETALAGLLATAGVAARELPGDLAGRAALWRDRMAGRRALLVLDNAASSRQVAPLLPGGDGCLVLVTSRRHLADLPGAATSLLLKTLTPQEARDMFFRLAPNAVGQDEVVAELLSFTGYLPLAISLLARLHARHPSWKLADLITEAKSSLLSLTPEADNIAAAFEVSYRHLDPAQQRFFVLLGLHPGVTTDPYAAAALTGTGLEEAAGMLDGLHGEGLLTETGYRRYGMHDLLRRYARDHAAALPPATSGGAVRRLLDYYQHTATLARDRRAFQTGAISPATPAPPIATPVLADAGQALGWARAERDNLLACLDFAASEHQHVRVIALTAALADLMRRDGPWSEAITRSTTALHSARHLGDRLGEATALNDLGTVRRLTGDYTGAAKNLLQSLTIYRDLGDRLGQANSLIILGTVRMETGDYPSAAKDLEQALAIHRDLGNRLGQAVTLDDLGTLQRVTGDYQNAAKSLKQALAIHRNLGNRLGQASSLNGLGMVRQETGDYQSAAKDMEQALAIYRDLGNRLGQANALSTHGFVRQLTGDYSSAARDLEEALAIYRDLGSWLGQANTLSCLGIVRRETGDYQGAAQNLEQALAIHRDLGEPDGEVTALNEAGTLHRLSGELATARARHEQALELARRIGSAWGEAHALAGLGRCAMSADHTARATDLLRQAHVIFQRIGTQEAPAVLAELMALISPGSQTKPQSTA